MGPSRSIVEKYSVTAAIGSAYKVFERTDDAHLALGYALERDPALAGFPVKDRTGIYWIMIPGRPSIQFPKLTAVYEVKPDEVFIHSIRIEHDGVIFHSSAFENRLGQETYAGDAAR